MLYSFLHLDYYDSVGLSSRTLRLPSDFSIEYKPISKSKYSNQDTLYNMTKIMPLSHPQFALTTVY